MNRIEVALLAAVNQPNGGRCASGRRPRTDHDVPGQDATVMLPMAVANPRRLTGQTAGRRTGPSKATCASGGTPGSPTAAVLESCRAAAASFERATAGTDFAAIDEVVDRIGRDPRFKRRYGHLNGRLAPQVLRAVDGPRRSSPNRPCVQSRPRSTRGRSFGRRTRMTSLARAPDRPRCTAGHPPLRPDLSRARQGRP